MRFEFATASRIVFGPGTIAEAGAIARPFGTRALLVEGRQSRAAKLVESLSKQSVVATPFQVTGEPTVEIVREGVAALRRAQCELVIGMGGGSVIDAGKAIAAMAANPGDLLEYLEVIGQGRSLPQPSLPFIAIPTTAGTGSEATRNAVLASTADRVKVSLRSASMLPKAAVIDPELARELPPGLTASTGLDALTQLIEPYVCARPNPMVDALCVEGMRRAARSLRVAVQNGSDLAAREDMALAALFSGIALANAGLGAVHGFAGPIGGMFPAPHGAVCAALLPHVMEMNVRVLSGRAADPEKLKRFDEVARVVTGKAQATARHGVAWVRELVRELRIPVLSQWGVTRDHIPDVVAKAARASSMKANPVSLTEGELAEILDQAL